jgi:hypothetical protein
MRLGLPHRVPVMLRFRRLVTIQHGDAWFLPQGMRGIPERKEEEGFQHRPRIAPPLSLRERPWRLLRPNEGMRRVGRRGSRLETCSTHRYPAPALAYRPPYEASLVATRNRCFTTQSAVHIGRIFGCRRPSLPYRIHARPVKGPAG